MSEDKKITSSIPLKALYGIGEDGSLFIIEPEGEFNIFRLSKIVEADNSEMVNSSSLGVEDLKLIINGDIKAVYSLPDFGLFIDEAIKGMLKEDVETLKDAREIILKQLNR